MGDPEQFRGLVLVRNDGAIKSINDLRGKKISYPAPTALAAAMMPRYYIAQNQVNFKKDHVQEFYVGSQESSILAVLHHDVDAGATWPIPWDSFQLEKPEEAKQLKVLFLTNSLINNSLAAKSEIEQEVIYYVKNVFINLHKSEKGKSILSKMPLSKFMSSSNDDYLVVEKFLKEYRKAFGKLPLEQ